MKTTPILPNAREPVRRFMGPSDSLVSELVQEIAKDFVAHYAGVGKCLAFGVKYAGGRLVDIIEFAQGDVFLDCGVQRTALHEGAYLGHFGGRKHSGYGTIDVAGLLPLFLVVEQGLFDRFKLADLSGGAAILCCNLGMGVHGKRKVAMD